MLSAAWGWAPVQAPVPAWLDVVRTLDGRYNSMQAWQADFTQIITGAGAQRTERGHLYLRKPGQMRWDYAAPAPNVYLVTGNTVWQYTPGEATATRMDLKDSNDLRTPLRFLLGHTELEKELTEVGLGGMDVLQPGDQVVHGKPLAGEAGDWSEVWIECSAAYEIDRVVIDSSDGSRNDIRFSQIKANAALPAALFKFVPPPGVTVVPGAPGGG